MKNSVIMATYNGEKYITEQMDSIRNQTLPPDEVIICDDCSSDNTRTIINEYISKYKLTGWQLYSNEKNIGFFDNFFKALRLSTGDIIYLSDQDDVWDKDKLRTFTMQFEKNTNLMMVQSDFRFIDEYGNLLNKKEHYHGFTNGNFCELTSFEMCKFAGSGYTMSFRRRVLEKIFDLCLNEKKDIFKFHDIMIGLVAVSEGECLLCRNIIDKHRIHENNITKKKNRSYTSGRTKRDQIDILEKRYQYFNIISESTIDSLKKIIFKDFALFSLTRKEVIEKCRISKLLYLIARRKMYASKVGVIVDLLYAFGFEKFICFIIG